MAKSVTFYDHCEAVFAQELGYGRRWKSSAAQALGIGRATLYRYFEDDSAVSADVWKRLRALSTRPKPVRSDKEMVTLTARALLDVQEEIDTHGWLKSGYPDTLRRVFDLSSARGVFGNGGGWPCNMSALADIAARPLFEWVGDLSWDPDGNYTAATLLAGGEITEACIELAAEGRDPETELIERSGYDLLKRICLDRVDGQDVYVAFRRSVISNPILTNWTSVILADEVLSSVEGIEDVVEAFYQPLSEGYAISGDIPVCKISGTVLRRHRSAFHTECRDPAAIQLANAGQYASIPWGPRAKQLRRAFRLYWCLPGLTELTLAAQLEEAGWDCELWPKLDRVDLTAVSPDGARRIVVDVKDYLSPASLATRFAGFKSYAASHKCYLVVPDYAPEISPGYERTFHTLRASHSKTPVTLRTLSALLKELGAKR